MFCMYYTWFITFKKIYMRLNTCICTDWCLFMEPYKTCRLEMLQTWNPHSTWSRLSHSDHRLGILDLWGFWERDRPEKAAPEAASSVCGWVLILYWFSTPIFLPIQLSTYVRWNQSMEALWPLQLTSRGVLNLGSSKTLTATIII